MKTRNAKLQLRELRERNSNLITITIASNFLLIMGVCIILTALFYMMVNLDKADSIITMWISFIAVGVSLAFWGSLFRLWNKK